MTDQPAEERARPESLRRHVAELEGPRHPYGGPSALERAVRYAADVLRSVGYDVERRPFTFRDREFDNLVARRKGSDPDAPRVLVGAHVDTVRSSPGADDNASGVAGLLESARLLAEDDFARTLELVVFNLEEQQGLTYRVGSRRFVEQAREEGVVYEGALILEMIGFAVDAPGTQTIPLPIRWMDLPRTGDFIAAVGDRGSRALVRTFRASAGDAAPDLPVATLTVPLRGWPVWATRRSDNASFWDAGWPALLITDTADLRNPHYHRLTDALETLDFDFMARVVDAVVETVRRVAGA